MSETESKMDGVGKALGIAALMLVFGVGIFVAVVVLAVRFASKTQ